VGALQRGRVCATQFHPEKSGAAGLDILSSFLDPSAPATRRPPLTAAAQARGLAKRVIACLDVRANDAGDLVVTKGDQYDVREAGGAEGQVGEVRNLGAPVELAGRYFAEGADEVTFLNITGFRDFPLGDLPMLEVLRRASEGVFVPLTVGGGIRGFVDGAGRSWSALEVAAEYFRSGADKVSIGGDAVEAAEELAAAGGVPTGRTAIEQISRVYGAQAVVVSIDPRRVYVAAPGDTPHAVVPAAVPGPNGEAFCWWQCTVKGGREGRDVDAVQLARAVEALGAGEILLNCIDNDGVGGGFDLALVASVADAVGIPVIASSGAGKPEHFAEVFRKTGAAAALAAGIFHRREVPISAVKEHMQGAGIPTRLG
jgi:glutamine amidotransferase/cyclase